MIVKRSRKSHCAALNVKRQNKSKNPSRPDLSWSLWVVFVERSYCSVDCQKKDWKEHKRSVCTKPAIFHKVDKLMKKQSIDSLAGSPLASLQLFEDAAWAERVRNSQVIPACDGCFRRFRGFPPREEEEEDENTPDAGDEFKHCKKCDWTICKDCTHPQGQGMPYFDRPPGTCRCPTANFGVSYCLSSPQLPRRGRSQAISR
ncbi:hypothetical protein B0H19DRAFT_1099211 [Mycena capillaripes]|nr:hypothetical protein B0H19DRAFT_1099211 [Mycena capillaripes]